MNISNEAEVQREILKHAEADPLRLFLLDKGGGARDGRGMEASHGFLEPFLGGWMPWFYRDSLWWTAFGFLGNAVFSARFVIQWWCSEKRKQIVVPSVFWHLSFWGSVIMLVYSLHVDKAPIILGYVALPVLYGRNLHLLKKGSSG